MADLPDEIKAVLTAACNLTDVFGLALIDAPNPAKNHQVILTFENELATGTMRRALVALEQAVVAWRECKTADPETAFLQAVPSVLEAIPTKPLDVEVRQWALALALETYGAPFDDQTMLMRERAADLFVRYAMTGTMPSDDPKPEDPA